MSQEPQLVGHLDPAQDAPATLGKLMHVKPVSYAKHDASQRGRGYLMPQPSSMMRRSSSVWAMARSSGSVTLMFSRVDSTHTTRPP